MEYKAKNKRNKETLLSCLADLFYSIVTQKRKVGTIAPKKFIARLRKEKLEFDNYMQQVENTCLFCFMTQPRQFKCSYFLLSTGQT